MQLVTLSTKNVLKYFFSKKFQTSPTNEISWQKAFFIVVYCSLNVHRTVLGTDTECVRTQTPNFAFEQTDIKHSSTHH